MVEGKEDMTEKCIKELLSITDHYESNVPFDKETVDKLTNWFDNYDLRCVCVPFTSEFFDTVNAINEEFLENGIGHFSLLYPDHLGITTEDFMDGTYVSLSDIGVMEVFEELELVIPTELINGWRISKLDRILAKMSNMEKSIKAIIQTPMLKSGAEIKLVTDLAVKNLIPFVKTGTGYFSITLMKHVMWMRDAIDNANRAYNTESYLKVAGGVRSLQMVESIIGLTDLIGTSKTSNIIEEIRARV